ncbi:NUDIX domain-containing protein [Neobacillus terrae]|uniref:NUDIX domain-containing protein n=1 Tax=Neobacillus terrae TaxID=3034837 RepID=UPI001409ED4F|nr:NUDIX domain-containing protein [Neobacillus terrae]NHM32008.1 NUDIX domain-containing protein [Neobacillus terrae]
MKNQIYVAWNGHHIKLTWCTGLIISDTSMVTSVHGYCFSERKVLLVNVKGRGFSVPGGHVEEGETLEEAFHREAFEEGYVRGQIQYIGALEVSHEENPLFDPKGKYPLIGYQAFYRMDIEEVVLFLHENETSCRIWVEPELVPFVLEDNELHRFILEEALSLFITK